jgi:GT2 family glycosyltransferase
MVMPRIYLLILNWNGWKDTIECLESIFRLDSENYHVIVCDNDSSDGSLENIKSWAEGLINAFVPVHNTLRHLSYPPVSKKIPYCFYDRNEAESGGGADDTDCHLILIQTGSNLGFAGGNNVGLRYILAKDNAAYVWLLNNDTVVEPNTLNKLVEKAVADKIVNEKTGIIGTKMMYYHEPDIIQGVGGVYNKWFATTKHIGVFEPDNGQYDNKNVVNKTDYPLGASMFVTTDFIKNVGLMCEDYFLYFEELDWVLRGKVQGWKINYCWQTRVFHKEGGTIGSSAVGANKSEMSDYFSLKNRVIFTKKFYPHRLVSVRVGFIVVLFNRIRRFQFSRIGTVVSIFLKDSSNPSRNRDIGHISS